MTTPSRATITPCRRSGRRRRRRRLPPGGARSAAMAFATLGDRPGLPDAARHTTGPARARVDAGSVDLVGVAVRALAPMPLSPPEHRPEDAGVVASRPLAPPAPASAAMPAPATASVPAAPPAPAAASGPGRTVGSSRTRGRRRRHLLVGQPRRRRAGPAIAGATEHRGARPGRRARRAVPGGARRSEGSVQDVRVRGRAPGSPADRHGAVAAAARRWQFDPAQLNGQAVRYTASRRADAVNVPAPPRARARMRSAGGFRPATGDEPWCRLVALADAAAPSSRHGVKPHLPCTRAGPRRPRELA